jgi:hypothetical protein
MSLRAALQREPHTWAKYYWPIALFAALVAFFVPYLTGFGSAGDGLLFGVIALGGVELGCAVTGQWQDTFSVWVWDSVGVTKSTPISQWNAKHFLTMIGYIAIVSALDQWLLARGFSPLNLLEDVAALGGSVWLLRHFFWHWWT